MHFKASHSHVNSSVWSPIRDTHLFYFCATFIATFSATFRATFSACKNGCTYWKLVYVLLDYVLDHFSFIIDGCKLTSIAQTVMAKLTYGLHVRGITPLRKLNHFSRLIMRSIWTLEVATRLVAVDAHADTLFLRIIGGAISTVLCKAKRSLC